MDPALYISSLQNPFDGRVEHPKLYDGKAPRSTGLRMKASGNIRCNNDVNVMGGATYIVFFAGLSNVICWKDDSVSVKVPPDGFPAHLESAEDRAEIKGARTIAAGLKLSSVNSKEQNDGYWEAARMRVSYLNFEFSEEGVPAIPTTNLRVLGSSFDSIDLTNFDSYQSGRIRDLERYVFRLNTVNDDIKFTKSLTTPDDYLSEDWDVIVVKIHGRKSAANSVIRYDCVSIQEVVYNENTSGARSMTQNSYVSPNVYALTKRVLVSSRNRYPANSK